MDSRSEDREPRFPALAREHPSTIRQLPGVHELLSATLPPPLTTPLRPRDSLAQPGPFATSNGHTFWQNGAPPYTPTPSTPHADVKPIDQGPTHPLAALQTTHRPYNPAAYHVPAAAPRYDQRPSMYLPPGPPAAIDIRRDSARPGFNTGLASPTEKGIRQQLFPGRGPCWVYSDGTTCPVSIDGEMVNPLWGTTKAGKARKRLAQACLSCREKKIRCEPQFPRCAQCEKAKRECIMPSVQGPNDEAAAQQNVQSILPASPAMPPRQQSPRPYKRRRSNETINGQAPSPSDRSPREVPHSPTSIIASRESGTEPTTRSAGSPLGPMPASITTLRPKPSDATATGWHIDPYEEDPDTTLHLLNIVFMPSMTVFNHMMPRALIRRWVTESRTKRPEEMMLLYTLLALGCAMSKDTSEFGQVCMHRAVTAMERTVGKFNFMLAQARLNMANCAVAQGQEDVASDYLAAAVHTIRMAGLTTEEGCADADPHFENGAFGMNAHQVIEAKRRTVWAAYVLEQVQTVHKPILTSLPEGLIHLRHACPEDIFERGLPSRASFFDSSLRSSLVHSLPDQTTTCPLAFITEISHLIGSQNAFAYPRLDRTHPGNAGSYAHDYQEFLHVMEQRLSTWLAAIPTGLRMTDGSFRPSAGEREMALAMSVTALYHVAVILTNRFIKHGTLTRSLVQQNIHRADQSAQEILRLAEELCVYGQNLPEGQILHHIIPPFLAYAITLAVDTFCAGGSLRNLPAMLAQAMSACTILDTLSYVWPSARGLYSAIERRLADLQEVERGAPASSSVRVNRGAGWWRSSEPAVAFRKRARAEDDCVYGVDDDEYLRSLGR